MGVKLVYMAAKFVNFLYTSAPTAGGRVFELHRDLAGVNKKLAEWIRGT